MAPVIVTVAPTGARRTRQDHPALPIEPEEIGREAARCREAGAAMIHLHVRDGAGRHSLDPDRYRAAIAAVRREAGADFLIQTTTEAVGIYARQEQMAAIRALQPEAFSSAVRELVPDAGSEPEAAAFFAEQAEREVLVQHILYDAADAARLADLVARGVVPARGASALFVLGRYTKDQQSSPADLLPFLADWHLPWPWAVCAFGHQEARCATAAACLGGHVRLGFENNLHLPDGATAADNAALVHNFVAVARQLGLTIADTRGARALFSGG
ncbi:MAG TPA: 3-keto-5-aminohexanoate cleavage protein [Beijerinckiaceae bacterium]|jgi:uncharacterized protein (DUF849 family)